MRYRGAGSRLPFTFTEARRRCVLGRPHSPVQPIPKRALGSDLRAFGYSLDFPNFLIIPSGCASPHGCPWRIEPGPSALEALSLRRGLTSFEAILVDAYVLHHSPGEQEQSGFARPLAAALLPHADRPLGVAQDHAALVPILQDAEVGHALLIIDHHPHVLTDPRIQGSLRHANVS